MVCFNSRLNHHLAFYAVYKKSLETEKNIDIDVQIEKLQQNGVRWNKVSLRLQNPFSCIYFLIEFQFIL